MSGPGGVRPENLELHLPDIIKRILKATILGEINLRQMSGNS